MELGVTDLFRVSETRRVPFDLLISWLANGLTASEASGFAFCNPLLSIAASVAAADSSLDLAFSYEF